MEYSKEMLIEEAIKRLDVLEETLQYCQESISAIFAERRVIRYLLFLGCEKEVK
jgi:hypothetical protein